MKHCFGEHWSVFVDAGVPVTVLSLTLGELGISAERAGETTPQEMAGIRKVEFGRSAQALRFTAVAAEFPDMGLSFIALEKVVEFVITQIRGSNTAAVFSFTPDEYMLYFDHPDHTLAGQAARIAATAADVGHFLPETPALARRPELYLRTTHVDRATQALPISESARLRRASHLIDHYPSQFSAEKRHEWEGLFDEVTASSATPEAVDAEIHLEYYIKVR